jgi:hypothetical protein
MRGAWGSLGDRMGKKFKHKGVKKGSDKEHKRILELIERNDFKITGTRIELIPMPEIVPL